MVSVLQGHPGRTGRKRGDCLFGKAVHTVDRMRVRQTFTTHEHSGQIFEKLGVWASSLYMTPLINCGGSAFQGS